MTTRAPRLRDAYELLLVLVAGWLLLFPVHRASLDHRNVLRSLPDGTVLVRGDGLVEGEELPAYRFHADWQVPIGQVRVVRRIGQDAVLAPAGAMQWPLGRHGRIVTEEAGTVVVDVGSELGLEVGRNLGVYVDRKWLGDVTLTEVGAGRSTARVAFSPDRPLAGLPVTEFSVMTQVVVRREGPGTLLLEGVLGFGPALAWLVARARGISPLAALRDAVRARAPWVGRALPWLDVPVTGLLLGAWAPAALALAVSKGAAALHGWIAAVPRSDPWPLVAPWVDEGFWLVTGGAAVWRLTTGASPLGAVSRALAWERSPVARLPARWAAAVNWALHLAIVWAFGSTLGRFLVANLSAARAQFTGGGPSLEGWFEVVKLSLWSITIAGCILGYAHTVLGPLFGKHVRSLDFTVAGWVTNAACYPLLGLAMTRLVGRRCGLDPVVSGGLAAGLLLALGLLTNVAYTASIWNMGRRFGVMTDKGLVSHGFYAVVRHPSYTLESLMFLMLEAPGYTTWHQWLAGLSVAWLYWLRSEREDAYMGASNPDYAPYRERVPDRYVPGVW